MSDQDDTPKPKPKRKARKVITARFAEDSLVLIEETRIHMGMKDRTELLRTATAAYVAEHHPTLGKKARRR